MNGFNRRKLQLALTSFLTFMHRLAKSMQSAWSIFYTCFFEQRAYADYERNAQTVKLAVVKLYKYITADETRDKVEWTSLHAALYRSSC